MFYLYACSKEGAPIILHVRGYSNEKGFGFVDGEGIFEVKPEQSTDSFLTMNIVKQVGVVCAGENQLTFNYTDAAFKELIGYKENNGYSSLDAALWKVEKTEYMDADGNYIRDVNHGSPIHFMYISAKTPIRNIPNSSQLFSSSIAPKPSFKNEEVNQHNRFKCTIL